MKGGAILVLAAAAVYLTAIGCAIWPSDSAVMKTTGSTLEAEQHATRFQSLDGLPFRGMVLQVFRIDSPAVYEKAIDDIAALGADTVDLVVDSRQQNGKSTMISVDVRSSPTSEKFAALIHYAKTKNLRVVVMPIVLLEMPNDNEWRGTIAPESWSTWFESYRKMVTFYAKAAQDGDADVFMVGSELVSTEKDHVEWTKTINEVRAIFKGRLTYSANWDHYKNIPFWEELDMISTNSYYKLGENKDVSIDEIVSRWRAIQKDLLPWVRNQHKPYMFTEVGWCSMANAAHEPWDYTKPESEVPVDLELQRKLYEGFFRAWNGVPELGGYMVWQWTPNAGGPSDRGYTPAGKPAEAVLKHWLAEPRWKVQVN